jgi:hypothetical protein
MLHTTAFMNVFHFEVAEFFSAQGMVKEGRENCTVALALQCGGVRF